MTTNQHPEFSRKDIENQVIAVLKTIFDPEIPVDIYELGLIYEIKVDETKNVEVVMTLTSPSCPVAESLPSEVEQKVQGIYGINKAQVSLVWEPPWDKNLMSEEAKLELGFL